MQEIQITLTLNDINQILDALGDRPYRDVFEIVNKIQVQAQRQLEQQPQPLAAGSEPEITNARQNRDG